jgi:hypothetical protein
MEAPTVERISNQRGDNSHPGQPRVRNNDPHSNLGKAGRQNQEHRERKRKIHEMGAMGIFGEPVA